MSTSEHHDTPSTVPAPGPVARVAVPALLLSLLAVVGAAVVIFGVLPAKRARAELDSVTLTRNAAPQRVLVAPATPASNNTPVRLPARIEALQDTQLFAQAGGFLGKPLVDIGDHVQAGQLLVQIDTPVLDQQIQLNAASAAVAEANVNEARARADLSRTTLKRLQDVGDVRAVSEQALDDAKGKAAIDEASLVAMQATLESVKADGRRLLEQKGLARIVAPFAGEITARNYDAGALVVADKVDGAKAIFRVTNRDELRVFIDLPQVLAINIKPDQKITLTVREIPGRTFEAHVVRASAAMDSITRTRLCEARLDNRDHVLLPGMFAEVSLPVPAEATSAIISAEALLVRDGKVHVAVVDDASTVHYRPIDISRDFGATIEVRSGVKPGDRVAISMARQPAEGAKVDAVDRDKKKP